jgi:integrase/recombinase XerD
MLMRERHKNSPSELQVTESLVRDHETIRRDFTEYLRARGYAEATIDWYQRCLGHAARWLHDSGKSLSCLFREEVWSLLTQRLRGRKLSTVIGYRKALFHWLKFQGRFRLGARPSPWRPLVDEYVQYLRVHRGVGVSAQENGEREAQSFLSWSFQEHAPNWQQLRAKDIWAYARHRVRRKTPRSANAYLSELRGFLRYVHLCGRCAPGLVAAVPHMVVHGEGHRCRTLSDGQRQKLLHAFERAHPVGRRDYAMTLCMLDLGLRATEVVRLQLEDIDWTTGRMLVPKTKSDRGRELPIPHHLLTALRQYTRQGRPRSGTTELFLRHGRRSGQPLTRGLIKQTLQCAYRRCGFPKTWSGTHRLRHTFATRLYGEHVEPKIVSDLLGHRHLDTTNIYVHLGPNALRSIAQPWPIRC